MASRTILHSTLSHSLARLRFWRASRRRRRRWQGSARANDATTLQNGIGSAAKGPTRRLRLDRVIVLCLVLISSLLAVLVGSFRHCHKGRGLLTQCPSGWKEGGAQSFRSCWSGLCNGMPTLRFNDFLCGDNDEKDAKDGDGSNGATQNQEEI